MTEWRDIAVILDGRLTIGEVEAIRAELLNELLVCLDLGGAEFADGCLYVNGQILDSEGAFQRLKGFCDRTHGIRLDYDEMAGWVDADEMREAMRRWLCVWLSSSRASVPSAWR